MITVFNGFGWLRLLGSPTPISIVACEPSNDWGLVARVWRLIEYIKWLSHEIKLDCPSWVWSTYWNNLPQGNPHNWGSLGSELALIGVHNMSQSLSRSRFCIDWSTPKHVIRETQFMSPVIAKKNLYNYLRLTLTPHFPGHCCPEAVAQAERQERHGKAADDAWHYLWKRVQIPDPMGDPCPRHLQHAVTGGTVQIRTLRSFPLLSLLVWIAMESCNKLNDYLNIFAPWCERIQWN